MTKRKTLKVEWPHEDTQHAMKLFATLKKKNKLRKFSPDVVYDYSLDSHGVYIPEAFPRTLFINPNECWDCRDATRDNPFGVGYTTDHSLFGTIVHEACHMLIKKTFPKMLQDYVETFPEERLILNEDIDYDMNPLDDELAEILSLHLTNPYLLKLISKSHWEFCQKYVKPTVPCSPMQCLQLWHHWPPAVKSDLKNRWGVVFNVKEGKFKKVETH